MRKLMPIPCTACNATGRTMDEYCPVCRGIGYIERLVPEQSHPESVPDPPETVNPLLLALARFMHPPAAEQCKPSLESVWVQFAAGGLCGRLAADVENEISIQTTVTDTCRCADSLLLQYKARFVKEPDNG